MDVKKEYSTPELVEFGDVEELTRAFGSQNTNDGAFTAGSFA